MSKEKVCFVIAPMGDERSDTRLRSNQVLDHIVKPAAGECGYKTLRADDISEPGIITSQIIEHLIEDPLVVADLTDHNPNVFYELAIRHAIRKPVVQLIQKGQSIPFDVAATRTISVDHKDLDSAAQARAELIKHIHAVEEDPGKVDTPISAAINFQSLRRSDNPLEKSTAVIISLLQELRVEFDELKASSDERVWQLAHKAREGAYPDLLTGLSQSDYEKIIANLRRSLGSYAKLESDKKRRTTKPDKET